MQAVFQRRGHPEIAAAAPQRPEQIGVVIGACRDDAVIGQHKLDRQQIVESERVLGHQPANPTPEGEATDARCRNHAAGRRKAMQLSLPVKQIPGEAALGTGRTSLGIDMHPGHRRQIDQHAAVDRRQPGNVVAATAHGDIELMLTRHSDRVDDVADAAAARNDSRTLVDEAVVDLPGFFVGRIGRPQKLSRERSSELVDRFRQRFR